MYVYTHSYIICYIHILTCMGVAEELGFSLVKSSGLDLWHYKNKEVREEGGKRWERNSL